MRQRIEADVLIPGRGQPLERGCVVLDGAHIEYAGSSADAPARASDDLVVEAPVVMPGMWDCHGHLWGLDRPDVERLMTLAPQLAVLRAANDARRVLDAGFTSMREVGGLGWVLAAAAAEGTITAPHIYSAGNPLSTTGGHADVHGFPIDWVLDSEWAAVCDGVAECLRQVRLQLRRGAWLIKVCASGGVMSEIDHPVHQQFSDEELAAIVAEAARAERIVAAHCHGKPGIMAALRAGCHTIEHGTCLDEEAAELMVERKAILVPTRFILHTLLGMLEAIPAYAARKTEAFADQHTQAMKLAVSMGVRIAAGCDIFTSGPLYGTNGAELGHLVAAGMTPLQAIEAATATGPETLGPQAPRAGQLREGFAADVITVAANPLDDIGVLADARQVTGVWLAGVQVKGAAARP